MYSSLFNQYGLIHSFSMIRYDTKLLVLGTTTLNGRERGRKTVFKHTFQTNEFSKEIKKMLVNRKKTLEIRIYSIFHANFLKKKEMKNKYI